MDYFAWQLLMLILNEELNDKKWRDIIDWMVRLWTTKDVNHVFSIAIHQGNLRLIKLISEKGVNAFEKAKDDTDEDSSPPIFSLIGCVKTDLDYKAVMDTIHSGLKTYRTHEMAALFRGRTPREYLREHGEPKQHETMTLLNEAVMEDDMKLAKFLLDFSDAKATNPMTEWDVLHSAVLTNNKEMIQKCLKKGLDPHHEASMIQSEFGVTSLAIKYFGGDAELCKRAFDEKDCFELARMRNPSNYLFLKKTYDNLKIEKKAIEAIEAIDAIEAIEKKASVSSEELIDINIDEKEFSDEMPSEKEGKRNSFMEITSVKESLRPIVFSKDDDSDLVTVVDCNQGVTTIYDLTKESDREKARKLKSYSLHKNLLEELEEFLENAHNEYYEGP